MLLDESSDDINVDLDAVKLKKLECNYDTDQNLNTSVAYNDIY